MSLTKTLENAILNKGVEITLPLFLQKSLELYFIHKDLKDNLKYNLWDCYFGELYSDINYCEVEKILSSDVCNYLRETYLYG